VEGWNATTWQATTSAEEETLFLSPQRELTNDDVVSTGVQSDEYGLWQVVVKLTDPAMKQFAVLSGELVDTENVKTKGSTAKRLAVLVDGKVTFAPMVREPIANGVLHLGSVRLTEQDARRIAKGIVSE